jgi:hypothetical protein
MIRFDWSSRSGPAAPLPRSRSRARRRPGGRSLIEGITTWMLRAGCALPASDRLSSGPSAAPRLLSRQAAVLGRAERTRASHSPERARAHRSCSTAIRREGEARQRSSGPPTEQEAPKQRSVPGQRATVRRAVMPSSPEGWRIPRSVPMIRQGSIQMGAQRSTSGVLVRSGRGVAGGANAVAGRQRK